MPKKVVLIEKIFWVFIFLFFSSIVIEGMKTKLVIFLSIQEKN